MNRICLYHGIDLDGFCSGAIYAKHARQHDLPAKLIPANYGWELPWEEFAGAEVTLIDFSMQPWTEFERLIKTAYKVIWIDHHKSAIHEYTKHPEVFDNIACFLSVEKAGCELAWEYYFPEHEVPYAVHTLGRYDVWDHSHQDTLPYQYGMRMKELDPVAGADRGDWDGFLESSAFATSLNSNVLLAGQSILAYQRKEDATAAKSQCFVLNWEGRTWLAANRSGRGSQFFDTLWDTERYHGMMSFSWNGNTWTVGLYSDRPNMDCGAIAKQYGGGGHPGAAGFRVDQLPFDLFEKREKLC